MSPKRIVNICQNGSFACCFVDRWSTFENFDRSVMSKSQLFDKLEQNKSVEPLWNRRVYLSVSGGTGGKNLYFTSDIQENRRQREILGRSLLEEKVLLDDDVALNLFQSNRIYRSMEIFTDLCSFANVTSIPMGADSTDESLLEIVETFRPNILMATPHRLTKFAAFLDKKSMKNIRFEKIFYAGETLDTARRTFLQQIFSCSIFIGFYGSAELGVFAFQTEQCSSSKVYFYPKELVHIEIHDQFLVVTNLVRTRNQLIRFNTGDKATILAQPDNDRLGSFEIVQSDRLICLGIYELSKSTVEDLMSKSNVLEWQLVLKPMENQIVLLEVRFSARESSPIEQIKSQLENAFDQLFLGDLNKLTDRIRFKFELISSDEFIRNPISNKLLRIVDQRPQ